MQKQEIINCLNCNSKDFVVDTEKSGFRMPNVLKLDENTQWVYETWFKCKNCGVALSEPIKEIGSTIEYTLEVKAQEK